MDSRNYLRRIGINDVEMTASAKNLRFLQRAHLLQVQFENLDIHWKRLIILDTKNFYAKIVDKRRGGFCYELNGLFHELLNELNFPSRIISARVAQDNGEFSREFDHLAILTHVEGEDFLVDVGFGAFTVEPLKFVLDVEQKDANGTFIIRKHDEDYFEVAKKNGEKWRGEYIFKNLERDLAEFEEMCDFHQTSPASHFTRRKICSLMTLDGRKTLTDKKFIETIGSEKIETEVDSEEIFNQILEREFNIKHNF